MLELINPNSIAKPFSRYSHTVVAPENCRWVHISGQVGAAPDGRILDGFEAQCRQSWANVLHALRAGGMGLDDVVKVNTFLTRREDIVPSRAVRDEALQGRAPANTLVLVSGLAHADLLVEIEIIAARPMPVAQPRPAGRAKTKSKAKARPKAKTRAKAKSKAKAKVKARPKARARPKAKSKTRAKSKAKARRR
jgi:enamine deaminase RidA (YjgF/YER057c/UK114 family)